MLNKICHNIHDNYHKYSNNHGLEVIRLLPKTNTRYFQHLFNTKVLRYLSTKYNYTSIVHINTTHKRGLSLLATTLVFSAS